MPRLLDLFCGAGGAAMGYARAGFEVVGVDIAPQPRYPFAFHRMDALDALLGDSGIDPRSFDAIHASPPCQAYTKAWRIRAREHPDLIDPVRDLLGPLDVPYVIENVPGAPLHAPITLCGLMFDLGVDRDRWFETSFPVLPPEHPPHDRPKAKMGRPPRAGEVIQVVGNFSGVQYAREAMQIPWMTRDELREAIPPVYTEWLGRRLMTRISSR